MKHENRSSYFRFAAMIGISMLVMYGVMYLNTFELDHVRFSETRVFMTLLMGASMAVIMLSFMWGMLSDKKINVAIYIGSAILFAAALYLVRSQTTVQDSSYMRAMIPHHSIAILTSERAEIEDLRVRQLADEIIESQRREIREMKWLLDDIRENGIARTPEDADARPVPEFEAEQ